MNDEYFLKQYQSHPDIADYINSNLRQSLGDIGLSLSLIEDLILSLQKSDIAEFGRRNEKELYEKFLIGFYKNLAKLYFKKEIVPFIVPTNKIIDVGCGSGTLANLLADSNKFNEIIAIDINKYQEWVVYNNPKVTFKQIGESEVVNFLSDAKPDAVVMTWALHHMDLAEQERYLKYLFNALKTGSRFIILEDAYSQIDLPKYRTEMNNKFMTWSQEDRGVIIGLNDWIANRILAQRKNMPIPLSYRTMEEWQQLFERIGYKLLLKSYLGFPVERDVNNPQSLIVFER